MPELNYIQTFEKVDETNYMDSLTKFERVLRSISLWNEMIAHSLSEFHWKVEDNGFIYSTIDPDYVKTSFSNINVRPLVMVFTKAIDSSFNDNWISFQLLIQTYEIRNKEKYIPGLLKFVRELCLAFSREFSGFAIYFADEGQEGEDFNAVRQNNNDRIGQFDYALIPKRLSLQYSKVLNQFETTKINGNWTEYVNKKEFE